MTQASDGQGSDVQVRWDVRIALRDGVQLSAILYLPQDLPHPAPALVTMTPYIAQSHHPHGMYFASHGYPFLIVDVRGRGNSDGTFHPRTEARDGYDVIEWLAQQSYCNGQVAMWGGSYLGRCQWGAAREHPPHLATIVPVAAPFYGVDVPMRNNVFSAYTLRWLGFLTGRALQDRIFADTAFWTRAFRRGFESGTAFRQLDDVTANPSALFQEWLSHPELDAYWESYEGTATEYAQITMPVLTVTGAYDGDQLGALEHYRRHLDPAPPDVRSKHYLIIGPWDHPGTSLPRAEFCGLTVGPASLIDLPQLYLQWYAWVLQGARKPEFLQKNVAYYVTGLEQWRYADRLEEITARTEPLYLASDGNATDVFDSGRLEITPPLRSAFDRYLYDPRDVSHASLESSVDFESLIDQRLVHARRGQQLVYHSAAFAADVDVAGFFRLHAWIAIDRPDTDLRAMIYDVALDGGALLLTSDWIRARYRSGLRQPRLIDTEAALRYDFERFTFVARRIRQGHRLRLVIGPINSIHWQKNYNSGGVVSDECMQDAQPVNVRLFHGEPSASVLHVPIGARE